MWMGSLGWMGPPAVDGGHDAGSGGILLAVWRSRGPQRCCWRPGRKASIWEQGVRRPVTSRMGAGRGGGSGAMPRGG